MSWKTYNHAGYQAQKRGDYDEAEQMHKIALQKAESVGRPHLRLAISLGSLAEIYRLQGKDEAAEPLFQRAIETGEQLSQPAPSPQPNRLRISPGDPQTCLSTDLNNLALLYTQLSRFSEAEHCFKRSVAIWKEAVGVYNQEMALRFHNLAALYYSEGLEEEGVDAERQASIIQEQLSRRTQ